MEKKTRQTTSNKWQYDSTKGLHADPNQYSDVDKDAIARTNEPVDELLLTPDSYEHVSDGAAFGQNDKSKEVSTDSTDARNDGKLSPP